MVALREHRQWLVNFQHDIRLISSTAQNNRHTSDLQRLASGLRSEHEYPLFNVI